MSDLTIPQPPSHQPGQSLSPSREAELRRTARDLEAAFLSEMLRHSGLGAPRENFGGGVGEDQFASLLRSEHARALAESGGIGLAESLFNALAAREGDAP